MSAKKFAMFLVRVVPVVAILGLAGPAWAQSTCEDNCYNEYNSCTSSCQSSGGGWDPDCFQSCWTQLDACLSSCSYSVRTGMTWTVLGQQEGIVHVGSDAQTNTYTGDTTIDQFLPILCVRVDGRAAPSGMSFDFHNGWARGAVQATPPIPATVLTSQQQGDEICEETFGTGWRLAEFHDGQYGSDFSMSGGWSYWAEGQLTPGTRFWVAINDQPANPWDSAGQVPAVALPRFIPSDAPVPGRYIAMFGEDTSESDVPLLASSLVAAYGGAIVDLFPAVQGFSFTGTDAQAQAMSQDYRVESVEQDSYGEPLEEWHRDRIDQPFLPLDDLLYHPNGNRDGTGVNIYVLDTGFRFTHQELTGKATHGIGFFPGPDDCNGHGTNTASVAGGRFIGVAPGASLVSVRVAHCNGNAYNPALSVFSSTIVAGLDWVARHHVKPAVANVSYGFQPGFWRRWLKLRTPMDRAVRRAVQAGVTVVVAAGNEGKNADRSTPARAPEAISVSATDRWDRRPSWANYGKVDIFAPGVGVTAASRAGDASYEGVQGTSIASPIVAGAAALYLQDHPTASPGEVRSWLQGNATTGVVINPGPGSANRLLYVGPGTWTLWLSRDIPTGTGDWELLADFRAEGHNICNGAPPIGIECRTWSGVDWSNTGEVYTCDASVGGICRNGQQPDGSCLDYRVRFRCP